MTTEEVKKEFQAMIDASKNAQTTEVNSQIEALKTQIEALDNTAEKASIEAIKAQLEEANEFINQQKENKGGMQIETLEKQVHKFIEENHSQIQAIKSQGHGLVEFAVKAVAADVTTQNATTPESFPSNFGAMIAPSGNVNLRGAVVESLVSKVRTSLAVYAYTETVPKDGDYKFVAEGKVKPQMDFAIETRYATPKKIAAWIKLTEESVKDIPGLQSIATDLLRKKHDLFKEKGLLFGDGVGENAKGATKYGRKFVAGSMAAKVENANIMDVINAGITDVYTTHNYEDETNYEANVVLVNPVDFFLNFVSAKTHNGQPLYPTASLFNRVVIGGVTIIPMEAIPAGKIFIADLSKYNITDWLGYTVKVGYVNDDFIKNQFVILGESRFHAFVKKLDEQAFIYDDIDAIKTAIEKPAPVGK